MFLCSNWWTQWWAYKCWLMWLHDSAHLWLHYFICEIFVFCQKKMRKNSLLMPFNMTVAVSVLETKWQYLQIKRPKSLRIKKGKMWKPKVQNHAYLLFYMKEMIHYDLFPPKTVNQPFYLEVSECVQQHICWRGQKPSYFSSLPFLLPFLPFS